MRRRPPRRLPRGCRVIYVASFRHKSGRVIRAADFGLRAFPIVVRDPKV
jgi:hypothetical protein